METVSVLFSIWGIFTAPAGVVTGIIVFLSRRRVDWKAWEAVVFILPFGAWALLMISDLSLNQKSLANLGEPLYFIAGIPIAAIVRVLVGRRASQTVLSGALIGFVSALAVAVFFMVPPLPEY